MIKGDGLLGCCLYISGCMTQGYWHGGSMPIHQWLIQGWWHGG